MISGLTAKPAYLRRLTGVFRGRRLRKRKSGRPPHDNNVESVWCFPFLFSFFILRSNNPGPLGVTSRPRRTFYNLNCFQESVVFFVFLPFLYLGFLRVFNGSGNRFTVSRDGHSPYLLGNHRTGTRTRSQRFPGVLLPLNNGRTEPNRLDAKSF